MSVYVGHLATGNFDFYFVAETLEQLETVAKRAWFKHQKATGAYYSWAEIQDCLFWQLIPMNSGIRR